jgi:hypothetical protein
MVVKAQNDNFPRLAKLCLCGRPVRSGQRNCAACHASRQRLYRRLQRRNAQLLLQAARVITADDEATRNRFQAAFKTDRVIVRAGTFNPYGDFSGRVVSYRPLDIVGVQSVQHPERKVFVHFSELTADPLPSYYD